MYLIASRFTQNAKDLYGKNTDIGLNFVWLSCKQDNTILCGTYIVHIKYPAQPLGYGILSSIVSSDDP